MALTAALHPPLAAAAAAFTFLTGSYFTHGFHRWSHLDEKKRPEFAKVLQKLHLTLPPKNHILHHKIPWSDYYCVLNGMWNPFLSRVNFWGKMEKSVYRLTGKEPRSWRDPGVKELALGKIAREEFLKGRESSKKQFLQAIKNDPEWQAVSKAKKMRSGATR